MEKQQEVFHVLTDASNHWKTVEQSLEGMETRIRDILVLWQRFSKDHATLSSWLDTATFTPLKTDVQRKVIFYFIFLRVTKLTA